MKTLTITPDHPCYHHIAYLAEQDEPAPCAAWTREDWNEAIVWEDDGLKATKEEWEYLTDKLPEYVYDDFRQAVIDMLLDIREDNLIPKGA